MASLVIFYALGIAGASLIRLEFWIIALTAVITFVLATLAVKRPPFGLILILLLALLTGCLNQKNSFKLSRCHIRNLVNIDRNAIYRVSGFIYIDPESKRSHPWYILRAQELQANQLRYKCCGELLVRISFPQELNYGDNLTLTGKLKKLPLSMGLKQKGRNYFASQGVYVGMLIQDPRQIRFERKSKGLKLLRASFRLRSYLERIIQKPLLPLPASILSAMILGQKRHLPWLVKNYMQQSGTVHILVVSGFNVSIVAFLANLLLKILRFKRKIRVILMAFCLVIYCLVTGASNPVVRATVMGLVFLAAYFLKREPDLYNSLFCAALFILIFRPGQLFDLGFQLSFASVLAIAYLYPKFKRLIRLEQCKNKILKFIAEGCLVSFSAWLGTLGIIAWNFRIFTPVTVLANMLIVPLATLITLCGFAMLLAGLISPGLAYLFSLPISMFITLLLNINATMVKLPLACIYF